MVSRSALCIRHLFAGILAAGGFLAVSSSMAYGGLPIHEMKRKTLAHSFQTMNVKVTGVVTWVDAAVGAEFYIQDATGGIQILPLEGSEHPRIGDVVTVTGELARGEFSPNIRDAIYERSGQAELPEPKFVSGDVLLNGGYSCERVRLDGWVRAAERIDPHLLSVVIGSGGARITIRITDSGGLIAEELVATRMVAIGVVTPVKPRGGTRQLVDVRVLTSPSFCNIIEREARNPWFAPVVPLSRAFSFRPGQTRGDRLHVAGKVLYRSGETIYLHDGTAGLAIRGSNVPEFEPGDWAEAIGFMDIENYAPLLTDSELIATQPIAVPIIPVKRTVGELVKGLQHAAYVTVTGELVDRMQSAGLSGSSHMLILRSSEGIFSAEIMGGPDHNDIAGLEPGSLLEVSGVCVMATNATGDTTGFKILVPGNSQIRLLRGAGFFTFRRLLLLLVFTLVVLLVASVYVYFGARRNMRLREEIGERRAVSAERNRLARDLHDTLEQGLTGIQMQLHCIRPDAMDAAAENRKRLDLVRSLVLQCHNEMRQSIWDLRSPALEEFDLLDALARIAQSLVIGSSTVVEISQQRCPVKIPQPIEDNLLRIGQEALTNAIKHASPTHLIIHLRTTSTSATLTVTDDGIVSPDFEVKPGHFGLLGMKERAERIGGFLTITRDPEGGCTVSVEVPLSVDAKPDPLL